MNLTKIQQISVAVVGAMAVACAAQGSVHDSPELLGAEIDCSRCSEAHPGLCATRDALPVWVEGVTHKLRETRFYCLEDHRDPNQPCTDGVHAYVSRVDDARILRGNLSRDGAVYVLTDVWPDGSAEAAPLGFNLLNGRRYLLIGVRAGAGAGDLLEQEVGRTVAPLVVCPMDETTETQSNYKNRSGEDAS